MDMENSNQAFKSFGLGSKIKRLRELKNFTQDFMAEQLQVSQSAYSKLEIGETEITYKRLAQIAEILQLKPEEIANFSDSMVFNVMHNQNGQNGLVINQTTLTTSEKELYERQIALLQEELAYLKELLASWIKK
jgi:transcriptional regulator with XRE-family HTH domain